MGHHKWRTCQGALWQRQLIYARLQPPRRNPHGHSYHSWCSWWRLISQPSLLKLMTQMPRFTCTDNVNEYFCETLSLGLLFKDAIWEGDGDRVFLLWKYLFLWLKASRRRNYSIEAFTLLSQYHLILPERLAEQLKWSRFINTHGHAGHNISCDLHMEHLNKIIKVAVQGLGANKTEKAIQRVGRGIGTMADTMDTFVAVNNVPSMSRAHSNKSSEKNL